MGEFYVPHVIIMYTPVWLSDGSRLLLVQSMLNGTKPNHATPVQITQMILCCSVQITILIPV